ncbi:MAG: c-type heme family protein [Campylobacter sp.]
MFAKYRFALIAFVFTALYFVILALFFNFYRELVIKDAKQEAFYVLDTMNAVRDYISNVQHPLVNELKEKGILDQNFSDPRLLSASHITRKIYDIQIAKKNVNYDYKLVAINPLNPLHKGDEFENEILQGFKQNRYETYSQIVNDANQSYVFVGLPIRNSQSLCATCHSLVLSENIKKQNENLSDFKSEIGDVMAMVSFKIPLKSILLYHAKEFIFSSVVLLFVFIVLIIFIYKIHQKAIKIKAQNEILMINQSRLASMGEMIANISHQWKQPLALISSTLINLELYNERGKLTGENLNEKIKEIDEQIKFMAMTIDDFKNFFNPNTPKTEFSGKEAIGRTCKLLDPILKKFAIEIQINIEQNFNHFGNINEVIQILINIINNAKDAFVENKIQKRVIKICSFIDNDARYISVENNAGIIDKNVIKKMFEPNFTTKKTGSGLGLYMSKMIMQKNNGTIEVYNLENGALFTIKFLNS